MTIFVKLIHRKCASKSHHSYINSHMTLSAMFRVVPECTKFPRWIQVGLSQREHNTWQILEEE